jgi:hypothetical protein
VSLISAPWDPVKREELQAELHRGELRAIGTIFFFLGMLAGVLLCIGLAANV